MFDRRIALMARVYRSATVPVRRLPNVFILGEYKCGTTSLAMALNSHPQFSLGLMKEPHFIMGFLAHKVTPWLKPYLYRGYFGPIWSRQLMCDATVHNFSSSYAAKFIRRYTPNAKLIVSLRNPVNRAYSHFHHLKKFFQTIQVGSKLPKPLRSDPFLTEIKDPGEMNFNEMCNIQTSLDFIKESERAYSLSPWDLAQRKQYFRYFECNLIRRGHYAQSLSNYLKLFPRSQILVLCAERTWLDHRSTLERAFKFLDLDPGQYQSWDDIKPHLVGDYTDEMDPETKRRLYEYYEPLNRDLFQLLGEEFPWYPD